MSKISFSRIGTESTKSALKLVLARSSDECSKQQKSCILEFIEHYNAFHTLVALELTTRDGLLQSANLAQSKYLHMTKKAQNNFISECEIIAFYVQNASESV